jgi:hypothetical protein
VVNSGMVRLAELRSCYTILYQLFLVRSDWFRLGQFMYGYASFGHFLTR